MSSFGFSTSFSYLSIPASIVLSDDTQVSNEFVFKFYPKFYDSLTMEWEVPEEWGGAVYNVYSSTDNPNLSTKLNPTPLTSPYFKDTTERSLSRYDSTFYVVEAILSTGQIIRSQIVTYQNINNPWVSLRKTEITRREWLLLRKFVGVKTVVFRRKRRGARCPECWDAVNKRIMKDNCKVCFGTSWEGGYWDPIPTLLQYDNTPNDMKLTYTGKVEPNAIQGWTINLPELQDLDLVVRLPDFRIYRVDRVVPTELQTITVRQVLTLVELSRDSIEFSLLDRIEELAA